VNFGGTILISARCPAASLLTLPTSTSPEMTQLSRRTQHYVYYMRSRTLEGARSAPRPGTGAPDLLPWNLLAHFGPSLRPARTAYHTFVAGGTAQGRRPE
jgi:hypothetical protein